MNSKKKIGSFRFGNGGEIAPGFIQLCELTTLNGFLTELENESDRSAVLVAAAFFDEALSIRLKKRLRYGSKKALDSLFDLNGPLSSFSAKIDFLFCLGDISKSVRDDLHAIRKIRNHCAHNWDSFRLDDEMETKYLAKLNTCLKPGSEGNEAEPLNTDKLHPRSRFIVICGMISLVLSLFTDTSGS